MQSPVAGARRNSCHIAMMDAFQRHVAACNNATLPGGRLGFYVAGHQVGWIARGLLRALNSLGAATTDSRVSIEPDRLQDIARRLADAGQFRWRDEVFDVRATAEGQVLAALDRGALPLFGVRAIGVHLNGLVRRSDGLWLWVARRSADKLLDPGKLDHVVAGGVPAGFTPMATLTKEAKEEAGLGPDLLDGAEHVGSVAYAMERPEGLRRDLLHCYDLYLPASFIPKPCDGEVEAFELWPLSAVYDRVRDTDDFKFNVNLVLIDLFRRLGYPAA